MSSYFVEKLWADELVQMYKTSLLMEKMYPSPKPTPEQLERYRARRLRAAIVVAPGGVRM